MGKSYIKVRLDKDDYYLWTEVPLNCNGYEVELPNSLYRKLVAVHNKMAEVQDELDEFLK